MAGLWKDERAIWLVACFTACVGQSMRQWKRSTRTADRKLARRVADELKDAAQGRRSAEAVKSFPEGIEDLQTRRGLYRVFDDGLKQTTGRGLGGKSARAFAEGWLESVHGEVSPGTSTKHEKTARFFLESPAARPTRT